MCEEGKITVIPKGKECDVEWKLNFKSIWKEQQSYCSSPDFSFEGESWNLWMQPNGSKLNNSTGFIDLSLEKNYSYSPAINVEFFFAFKSVNGRKYFKRQKTGIFEGNDSHYITRFLRKSDLDQRQSEFLASGFLTVVCTLKILNSTGSASDIVKPVCSHCETTFDADEISVHEKKCRIKCPDCFNIVLYENWHDHECQISGDEECSYCHKSVDAGTISVHEKMCMDRPIKCPKCPEVVLLQNWCDHECHIAGAEGVESLSQDLRNVFLDGCDHDLVLKINNREFRAHKVILRARSRVFKSMLTHDMAEKNSGVIDIPDCDPQAMEQFLFYVYTGKVVSIDQSNMTGLYYIADKYEMKDLKEESSKFIKKSLSTTNFCDVIQLAMNHSDSNLLDFATDYFTSNMLDILRTVEWQSFMKDNSTVANEILIKSCEKKK